MNSKIYDNYEISHRHSTGVRKAYFIAQNKLSPANIKNMESLANYSGFEFKTASALTAYIMRTCKQIDKIALFSFTRWIDREFLVLACVAKPLAKNIVKTDGNEYIEDYLKLEFYTLQAKPSISRTFMVLNTNNSCEVSSHTVERIIQRLKTTNHENITDEISSSARSMMNIFSALDCYDKHRWPNKIVIPSKSGAFLAEIDPISHDILFRTFVKDEMFDFQERSVNATRAWVNTAIKSDMSPKLAQLLFTDKANKWWFEGGRDQKFTYRS